MKFEKTLYNIINEYKMLNDKMQNISKIFSQKFSKIAIRHFDLSKTNYYAINYFKNIKFFKESQNLLFDNIEEEIVDLAFEQRNESRLYLQILIQKLRILLLPKKVDEKKNALIEIRAGAGGDEAALFVNTLLKMYKKYAEKQGWKFDILSISGIVLEGCKEVIVSMSGQNVYKKLQYESGVHRVQRVPSTESNGRIHTSAVTVAVLPEAEDIDVIINDKDLRIDSYKSSGAGGQHVNTTDSAIRITHIPTGLIVVQSEKSQHQNKAKALKILKAKLYNIEKNKKQKEASDLRKYQIGNGDRSERIRTYNFPQNRVTDHRINITTYNLYKVLYEAELDQFINAFISDSQIKRM